MKIDEIFQAHKDGVHLLHKRGSDWERWGGDEVEVISAERFRKERYGGFVLSDFGRYVLVKRVDEGERKFNSDYVHISSLKGTWDECQAVVLKAAQQREENERRHAARNVELGIQRERLRGRIKERELDIYLGNYGETVHVSYDQLEKLLDEIDELNNALKGVLGGA